MSEQLTVDNFTHLLECSHRFRRHVKRYWMKCHILSTTKSGSLKVQVYGRLYWGGDEAKIRYVEPIRVRPKSHFEFKES
ncbi:hypothetical protein [Aeromonas phage 59.1]|nr:hypothetical protein [Aeromonas phage 59.1]